MISIEEAYEILEREAKPLAPQEVPLARVLGRVLASCVVADQDNPPFDRSAMDGFAFRSEDHTGDSVRLCVVGTLAAGDPPRPQPLEPGEAVAIMTGAPVPPGADQVKPVEVTRRDGEWVEILESGRRGAHIRVQGEVVRQGETVLAKGVSLTPERVGVLATVGIARVPVVSQPKVWIAPTGDELVPVEETPKPGQIRDSNRWALAGVVQETGCSVVHSPALGDTLEEVQAAIAEGLKYPVMVLTGGVSMGEFDFVDTALRSAGVTTLFHKVAMKPGKPVYVGKTESTWVFGLPGNPVSALVCARLFMVPVLRRLMGCAWSRPVILQVELTEDLKPAGRRSTFVTGRLFETEGSLAVAPVSTRGSSDAIHHAQGDCLIFCEAGAAGMKAGSMVPVWLVCDQAHLAVGPEVENL